MQISLNNKELSQSDIFKGANTEIILIKVYTFLRNSYLTIFKLPTDVLRVISKILVVIFFWIFILPILYPILAYYSAKFSRVFNQYKKMVPVMATSDLEKTLSFIEDIELRNNISLSEISFGLLNSPVFLKPIAFTIKETMDQVLDLKATIKNQISLDQEMFADALSNDLPVGYGHEMTAELN